MVMTNEIIRYLIREELGKYKFSTGALSPKGHALILFAKDDQETFEFSLETSDKEKIFKKAISQYEKRFGESIGGDMETTFYDFMAHYKRPGTIEAAEWIFGDMLGKDVKFEKAMGNTRFIISVDRSMIHDVQRMADRAGYVANLNGIWDDDEPIVNMVMNKRSI